MSQQTCVICRQKKDTSWPGARKCPQCGFLCSNCATKAGANQQCPKCKRYNLQRY